MQLTLRIVGGFTGPAGAERHQVCLDQLPEAQAERLRALVAAAGLAGLPDQLRKPAPAAWDFTFQLTIRDGGHERTLCFHRDVAPEGLRALCDGIIGLDG